MIIRPSTTLTKKGLGMRLGIGHTRLKLASSLDSHAHLPVWHNSLIFLAQEILYRNKVDQSDLNTAVIRHDVYKNRPITGARNLG